MDKNLIRAWRGIALPLLAIALLLPSVTTFAEHGSAGKAAKQLPTDGQIRDYNEGVKIWETARGKDARERSGILEKAARSFQAAIKPNRPFPEANLALGLVRYSQNNLTGAEALLSEAARISRGPVRIEALTNLGMVAMRQKRYAAADEAFEAALKEDPRDYDTWSKNVKIRTELLRDMAGRGEHFKRIARIGSLLASFYGAAEATPQAAKEAQLRALLDEIKTRFPDNELPFYQFEVDDVKAALVLFPPGPVDLSPNLLDGRPAGSNKVTLEDMIRSIRVWALAELAQPSPSPLADLSPADRRNAVAGIQRRAIRLEDQGNLTEAQAAWAQIAGEPQTALQSRQHRIWIALQGNNLPAARALIRGPGAANDPAVYDQQLAYASAVLKSAPATGPQRQVVMRQAVEEYRGVLDGLGGLVTARPSEPQRSLAEWNIGALDVSTSPQVGPAEWEQRLNRFPALPGREAYLLFMAYQWADTAVDAGQPAQVSRALAAAEKIANGSYAPGLQAVPRGAEFMILLRRYVAKKVFDRNEVSQYTDILRSTDYGGEYRGWDAAKVYRARTERLRTNPNAITEDAAVYDNILKLLMEARTMTGGNADLERRLDTDIAATRAYLEALRDVPRGAPSEWNRAAALTANARTADDWQKVADAWRGVLRLLAGRPAAERRAAAMHVVNAYLKQADVLYAAKDGRGAAEALDQARVALSTGGGGVGGDLTDDDRRAVTQLIQSNLKAANPKEVVRANPAPFIPFSGKVVPPDQNRCVITRYPAPIQPDVDRWVENLRSRPSTVRRLVDWFNNGPLARRYPDAKRNFSANPSSPNYLVDFLDRNLSRSVGVLPVGSVQWCDHNGAGPWHSAITKKIAAAYFLRNGTPVIRVACDNPLNPIRVGPPAVWTNTDEKAPLVPVARPNAPVISYGQPQAPFSFPVPQSYKAFVLPRPGVGVEIIIMPPVAIFIAPYAMPILPLEICTTFGQC